MKIHLYILEPSIEFRHIFNPNIASFKKKHVPGIFIDRVDRNSSLVLVGIHPFKSTVHHEDYVSYIWPIVNRTFRCLEQTEGNKHSSICSSNLKWICQLHLEYILNDLYEMKYSRETKMLLKKILRNTLDPAFIF